MLDTLVSQKLIGVTCCNCGILFGMNEDYRNDRLRDHVSWHCPNGHSQHYSGKSTEEKLREDLAAEQVRAARARTDADYQCQQKEAARRSLVALRGHATRLKRRVAAGACPCCHARFKDLAEHMAVKHPGYAEAP